jgi:RNA polymerase sigma-70 factor (ECF subfamily)
MNWLFDKKISAEYQPEPAADGPQSLEELIVRIVERDQAAFAEFYASLLERVYGLALRITRNPSVAEEVAEDTFWQVWRQAPRFDPIRGNALAWVMTIARSRALDALRRVDTECEPFTTEMASGSADNPYDLLAAVEQGGRVHSALAALAPMPRQLVALAFFQGLSHDEIATYTQMPLGTVKSQIRRALLSLRQTLAEPADFSN